MVKTPSKANPRLPEGVLEHVSYPEPREFDGVNWRDLSDIRERLTVLETHHRAAEGASGVSANWKIAIVSAVAGAVIASLATWGLARLDQEKGEASQPPSEQTAGDKPAEGPA